MIIKYIHCIVETFLWQILFVELGTEAICGIIINLSFALLSEKCFATACVFLVFYNSMCFSWCMHERINSIII